MLNRRNNNQTNRQQIPTSTFKALASPTNNNSTSIMSNERKISLATEGLQRSVKNWLRIKTSNENALAISEYVLLLRREVNPSQNYTKIQIQALVELSEYLKQKPFKQLTTEDVLSFLDKFRKTEDKDPPVHEPEIPTPHEALMGQTPAEVCGIRIEGSYDFLLFSKLFIKLIFQ